MPDIKTLAAARNVDLVNTFTKSLEKLTAMLSTCAPIHAAVGETLHQKKITGKLSEAEYTPGQDIPLSSYAYEDVTTYEVTLKPYRKQTTLQEVKKRGYDGAVDKTEWIDQIRTVSTATSNYYIQESLHPNYWGQLAERSCVRMAYNGGAVRGGSCTIAGTGLLNGEPRMKLA